MRSALKISNAQLEISGLWLNLNKTKPCELQKGIGKVSKFPDSSHVEVRHAREVFKTNRVSIEALLPPHLVVWAGILSEAKIPTYMFNSWKLYVFQLFSPTRCVNLPHSARKLLF